MVASKRGEITMGMGKRSSRRLQDMMPMKRCGNKKRYMSFEEAQLAVGVIGKNTPNSTLEAYWCYKHQAWHIGHHHAGPKKSVICDQIADEIKNLLNR